MEARLDVARVRGLFPGTGRRATCTSTGPVGALLPEDVARAVGHALRMPVAERGGVFPASARAEGLVAGARSAVADLVGGVRGRRRPGRQHDRGDVRDGPGHRQDLAARRRDRGEPARPRRQHPALGAARRGARRARALGRGGHRDRRAARLAVRRAGQPPDPPGRAHRRQQRHRHLPGGRRDRPPGARGRGDGLRRRLARRRRTCTWTAPPWARTSWPCRRQVVRPARRRRRRRSAAAGPPAPGQAAADAGQGARPLRGRGGSPTSCTPASPPPSTTWPG